MKALFLILATFLQLTSPQDGKKDSLVRLMSAQSAQLMEINGHSIRKVTGPARFLHNDTYLLCDTAYWDVDSKIINAYGNVQILQNETVLTSDKLDYLVDEDLAQFRGGLVQLQDKDGNILRTNYLDYNTKDSVAVFSKGGAMRDKDGQLIESIKGTYDSKVKTFTFDLEVNMFSDSIFVSTSYLQYMSRLSKAFFSGGVNAWKGDNMLSSRSGHYNSADSTFFFNSNVHIMTKDQEGWADSLYFYRPSRNILMLSNAQVLDTTRSVAAVGDYMFYEDSISTLTLRKNAALMGKMDNNGQVDTVYMGADNIRYWTKKMCDVQDALIADAKKRLDDLKIDPVSEYRKKAAEDAAKEAKEAQSEKDQANKPANKQPAAKSTAQAGPQKPSLPEENGSAPAPAPAPAPVPADTVVDSQSVQDTLSPVRDTIAPAADTLAAVADSLSIQSDSLSTSVDSLSVQSDTLSASADSLLQSEPLDTTKVGFARALGSVRVFKRDIQVKCDSLEYSDLDSLARMFNNPIVWNEGNRQYRSDSLTLLLSGGGLKQASLMSNAFIIIQEDSLLFDQIRGSEMMAYFDSTSALSRFDALGGASAVFYLEENDALATANKVESKMLSATFVGGDVEKVYYYDSPKNNAYPTVQLPSEDKRMKGFLWNPELRPNGKEDITTLEFRPSERSRYNDEPRPSYTNTEKYFPGYIEDIYRQIQINDSLRLERRKAEAAMKQFQAEDSLKTSPVDSLGKESLADSTSVLKDSTAVAADSLSLQAAPDSTAVADSLSSLSAKELQRKLKQEEREKRWAELDARDEAKAKAKEAKITERKRRKALKLMRAQEKEAITNQRKRDRYIERYQKQKLRATQQKVK